jgi:succinoglycan biosynthesis transport protein ExoP
MAGAKSSAGFEPPQPAVPVTGLPGAPVEQEVHVLDRLHVLYKYRKAMISVTLLVLIGGIVQTYTTTPAYESTAQVRVQPESQSILALQQTQQTLASADPESFMQTELSVLQSRDLTRKVVRKLKLDQEAEFTTPQGPQGLEGQFNAIRGRIMGPIMEWLQPSRPAAPGVATGAPPRQAPTAEQVETPEERAAIETMTSNLNVALVQISYMFNIKFSSSSPEKAALVANTLAQEYEKQNLERRRADISARLAKISEYVTNLNAEIVANQQNLITKTTEANVLDTEQVSSATQRAQADFSTKTAAVQEAQAKVTELEKLDPERDLATALKHPDIQRLGSIAAMRGTLNGYLSEKRQYDANLFASEHPQQKDVDRRIAQAEEALRNEIRATIDSARTAQRQAAQAATAARLVYEAQQRLQVENSKTGIPYQQLRTRVTNDQITLQEMSKQQKDLEILAQGVDNNVSIIEYAQPASKPYKPNTPRNILMSLAVGLALAIMLAFGLDYIDDTIKTPEDVTRKLHIPFLGLVPSVRGDRHPVLSGPVPHDFGEAYRALRTSLVFTSGGETTRMITVTSAQPLEGKTTTACNLAMVLAFGGSRVLLIDADMRRPGVHKTLKMNNTVGLSHLLVGQARVREAIQRTSDPNFCVMTAGRTPPNPSELLASERMKQLIATLKQGPFDWVVIDTPPVLAVTDAVILTPLVDGVTFVLGAEMTRRRLAERAVQMLMVSRPRVIGGVLNRVNFDRNKYYYSRYYGYQYKSYYGTDAPAAADPKA